MNNKTRKGKYCVRANERRAHYTQGKERKEVEGSGEERGNERGDRMVQEGRGGREGEEIQKMGRKIY